MSDYKLITYSDGKVNGTGEYETLCEAIAAAAEAPYQHPCDEWEILDGETRQCLCHGITEDMAIQWRNQWKSERREALREGV